MSKQNRDQSRVQRAAAVRAAQDRKERNRRIGLFAAILVVLGAIVAGGVWYSSDDPPERTPGTSATVTAGEASLVLGDSDAPVKVTIYEDFLCPYCRQLEEETRDFLRDSAESGKVQVTYQPINLLQQYAYSARALNVWAAALKNASPQAALELHDLLFENQPYESASDGVSEADLLELADEAGAGSDAVTAAAASQDTAFFAAAQEAMTTANVQGTPTVWIDGKALPQSDMPTMVDRIEEAVSAG